MDKNGQPWNSPVFSAFDESYNFYWGSYIDSQHSKNIRLTSKAFIVIYDSTVEAGEGLGVYIKAKCIELTNSKEIEQAHKLLQKRRPVPYWRLDELQKQSPIRLYKAIPEQVWVNSDREIDGHYIDTMTEVKLNA